MIAALVALAMAQAQTGPWTKYQGPFKLVIVAVDGGVAVTDYPSFARCERAGEAIEADRKRRIQEANDKLPSGGIIQRYGVMLHALCIPG